MCPVLVASLSLALVAAALALAYELRHRRALQRFLNRTLTRRTHPSETNSEENLDRSDPTDLDRRL